MGSPGEAAEHLAAQGHLRPRQGKGALACSTRGCRAQSLGSRSANTRQAASRPLWCAHEARIVHACGGGAMPTPSGGIAHATKARHSQQQQPCSIACRGETKSGPRCCAVRALPQTGGWGPRGQGSKPPCGELSAWCTPTPGRHATPRPLLLPAGPLISLYEGVLAAGTSCLVRCNLGVGVAAAARCLHAIRALICGQQQAHGGTVVRGGRGGGRMSARCLHAIRALICGQLQAHGGTVVRGERVGCVGGGGMAA
jgi:hypothetical protein